MATYLYSTAKSQAQELAYESVCDLFGAILPASSIEITRPKDESLGDYSCPISFKLATSLRNSPNEISQKLANSISGKISKSYFSQISSNGGFINFRLSDKYFKEGISEIKKKKDEFGKNNVGRGKKAIVEFSSPNIGKPMHIGHIRSTILGDCVARVLKFNGYSVISSNYLCEAGLQTAKLLLSVQLFGTEKIETEKDLLALYVKIHQEMEKNPDLEKKAQELVLKMETGDKKTLKELSMIRKLSIKPFDRNYKVLDIDFTEQVFDSDYVEEGRLIVEDAVSKQIAFRDKTGETVANLEQFNLPNLVVLRSNGTTLYSTRDLGLASRDFKKYKFDLRIYVTASEQNLHFQQVFAILSALQKPFAKNLRHIGFGIISLEDGKLSTREGRVLLLEDVINDSISLALLEVKQRQDYSDREALEIAAKVGIAALKYSILKISSEKDIKFSLREAVKFDGNTAAYLQYTCVRAKNILAKANEGLPIPSPSKNRQYSFTSEERKLVLMLSQFPEVVGHSARNLTPYLLCEYLFKLALSFSSFYDKSAVLKAESTEARTIRLEIVKSLESVMTSGLNLLGINVPAKM
ncbi:arginine--tRNA ligase [Candidatus Micrarchaeota archaeon]|nr:arginine--tRNA ligase [Candidatus Micrarchaeota archaeon]